MSYTKQTWTNGDLITASKLNHIEDGISDAGAGFDVVIKIDKMPWDENLTDSDLHLVKGSYSACVAKITAVQPITACVFAIDGGEELSTSCVFVFVSPNNDVVYFTAMYTNSVDSVTLAMSDSNELFLD